MNLILVLLVPIVASKGNIRRRIKHAGFESIKNGKVVGGAQLVCHVTPALFEGRYEVWIISDPGRDPGIRGGGVVVALGAKIKGDREVV